MTGPGGKSFADIISDISERPYEERKAAERRLASQAVDHIDSIANLLKVGGVGARRSVVEILSHMQPSKQVHDLLLQALFNDRDVKVRRRAAAALGGTGDEALQEFLVRAFEQEEHRFVQASIILALGALGFAWTSDWEQRIGSQGPVAEAFRKASARSDAASGGTKYAAGEHEVQRPSGPYMLESYPGVEQFVETESKMRGVKGVRTLECGWLRVDLSEAKEEELKCLGELRSVLSTYAAAAERPFPAGESLEDYVVGACGRVNLNVDQSGGRTSFRLELPRMDSRAQYRKATVRLARLIAAETGWSNNPSNYSLDIRVARINSSEYVLWRDVRWREPRRSEPRAVLPASIHPTVAAALCMAGGIVSADVFCDPCCGAGTIIAERLGYGPAKEVFGFDISKEAVRLSQQNLSRFSSAVKLRMADMRSLPLENKSVTIIVANLPFGIRVGDRGQNRNLYRDFLKEAYRVLTPKGRLIAYTHDASAFESGCRDAGWQGVQRVASVQAGGLTVLVYRGVRS